MTSIPIIYIIIGILIIAICAVILVKNRLTREAEKFDDEISTCLKGPENSYNKAKESVCKRNEGSFVDIEEFVEHCFDDRIITPNEKEMIVAHFQDCFDEAYSLLKKLEFFHITPTDKITKMIKDFGAIPKLVERHNEAVIQKRLESNKDFFNHCLNYPLDQQQRRSIVSEADNCLVVSSAGSGKTSSIVGKVKYLIEKRDIAPERILLISYTNKAATELTERMGIQGLRGYTFHKLAMDLIGNIIGQKPSICDDTDTLFVNIYRKLRKDKDFQK